MVHWNSFPCTGELPTPRSNAFMAILGHRCLLMGGTTSVDQCNEAYYLDLHNRHWSRSTIRGDPPPYITSFGTKLWNCSRQQQDFMVSTGTTVNMYRNGIFILDPRTMRWVRNDPKWLYPYYPSYAGEVQGSTGGWDLNNGPLFFGGADGEYSNVVQGLDMRTWKWMVVNASGDVPTPRSLHATTFDEPQNRMIVYGGFDGKYLDDLYTFSLKTCRFEKIQVSEESSPGKRAGAALLMSDPNTLVVHGGTSCGGAVLSTCASIRLTSHSDNPTTTPMLWEANRIPSGAQASGHTVVTWRSGSRPTAFEDSHLSHVLFGGHDGRDYLNETCVYWDNVI
eukprot:PhF_6_TR8058/c0_g1_i2/m.12475